MPLDVMVEYTDGTKEFFYIPNTLMRWEKPNPYPEIKGNVLKGWDWAYPTFVLYHLIHWRERKMFSIAIRLIDFVLFE